MDKKSNIEKCFMFFFLGSDKKGILVKNLLGLIIAAAAVFILSTLLFKLIAPPMDEDRLTLESYMNSLRLAIADADNAGVGEFSVLILPSEDIHEKEYFMVYFGNSNLIDYLGESDSRLLFAEERFDSASSTGEPTGDKIINYDMYYRFFLQKQIMNGVCICSNIGDVSFNDCYGPILDLEQEIYEAYCDFNCGECVSLDWPAVFEGESVIALGSSNTVKIRKGEGDDEKTKYFFEEV